MQKGWIRIWKHGQEVMSGAVWYSGWLVYSDLINEEPRERNWKSGKRTKDMQMLTV